MRLVSAGSLRQLINDGSVDALIFDLEGVVIDTEHAWDLVQRELLARRGHVYDRAAVKHLLTGLSAGDSARLLIRHYGLADTVPDLVAERSTLMLAELGRGVPWIDGFGGFFAGLPAPVRARACVATGMASELFDAVDPAMRVSELFGGRIHRTDALGVRSKPAPDVFAHAAAAAGADPARCVVFEDSPNGVEAALAAGMRCVALTTTHPADLLKAADLIVDDWGRLGS